MPLVTVTVRKPKSTAFKTTVLDAVHAALVSCGVRLPLRSEVTLRPTDQRISIRCRALASIPRTSWFASRKPLGRTGRLAAADSFMRDSCANRSAALIVTEFRG
jgi:hypothetical protein